MIKFIVLFSSLFFISCSSTRLKSEFKQHPLSIVQGVTSETETVLSVLSYSNQNLNFFYGKVEEGEGVKTRAQIPVTPYTEETSPLGKRKVSKFHIKNLKLGEEYFFTAVNKETKKIVDERGFKALDLKMKNPKIGIASCFDDRQESITPIWKEYLNQNTDINFFIGDNSYADKIKGKWGIAANKTQLWTRYAETFERLYFYHSSFLTPTLYLWDDHDYGLNDGGKEFIYKKDALKVFKTFYPLKEMENIYKSTLGAGSLFKAFGQNFLFIDARYYRSHKFSKKQTQWGFKQEKEVFKLLGQGKFTWLIQGDQYFGAYHPFESYERDRPESFLKTLSKIKKSKSKVVFVSGDRHLTEIMDIKKEILGYRTYEITSSGMHAKVFPGSYERTPNPKLLVGKSGVYNFTIVKPVLSKKKITLDVSSKGLSGKTHYKKQLEINL